MRNGLTASLAAFGFCLLPFLTAAAAQQTPPAETPRHWPVLEKYCVDCHNTQDWAGGIAFDTLTPASIGSDADTWEKAVRKLRTGMMPPPGKPRPERATLDRFASELATRLDQSASAHPVPGTKSLHRLNRAEYANAVRDLISYRVDASMLLPADNTS